jgi:hypothetical protein
MKLTKSILALVIISVGTVLSCSSPERKIKKAIYEELRLTLHDFKSYEPVQFGKLEVAESVFTDLPEVSEYLDKSETYLKLVDEYNDKADIYDSDYSRDKYYLYSRLSSEELNNAKKYLEKVDSIKLHFDPVNIGWQMSHSFRAKSLGGNLGIHHYIFIVDKEYKKVIKTIDLDKD